jgi:hypothetical protein
MYVIVIKIKLTYMYIYILYNLYCTGMVAVKLQAFTAPPMDKIIEFCYDTSRRPSALTRMASNLMSALSSSFGLGETAAAAEAAEAADPREADPAAAPAGPAAPAPFDPNSVVSSLATPTSVLSFLPPPQGQVAAPAASSASPAAPPTAPVLPRSDSDMARELDKQLNGGGP